MSTTPSPYWSEMYRQKIGLKSTGIESPIEWAEVEAPTDMRKFVTFVNPSLQKGAMLLARLADMLGQSRPDIPLLIVQSASGTGGLNAIAGLDFEKHPQIMVAPATTQASTYFALTTILLVPSAVNESFWKSRGGGVGQWDSRRWSAIVARSPKRCEAPEECLPWWLDETSRLLPSIADAQPWFDAVCEWWDDAETYERACD
jgi:hypothetical protein